MEGEKSNSWIGGMTFAPLTSFWTYSLNIERNCQCVSVGLKKFFIKDDDEQFCLLE
jgi:hypothetical protein